MTAFSFVWRPDLVGLFPATARKAADGEDQGADQKDDRNDPVAIEVERHRRVLSLRAAARGGRLDIEIWKERWLPEQDSNLRQVG